MWTQNIIPCLRIIKEHSLISINQYACNVCQISMRVSEVTTVHIVAWFALWWLYVHVLFPRGTSSAPRGERLSDDTMKEVLIDV